MTGARSPMRMLAVAPKFGTPSGKTSGLRVRLNSSIASSKGRMS